MRPILERIFLGTLIAIIGSIIFIASPILLGSLFIVICWIEIVNLGKRRRNPQDILVAVIALLYMTLVCHAYIGLCRIHSGYAYQGITIAVSGDFGGFLAGSFVKKYSQYRYRSKYIKYILNILAFKPFKISPNKTIAGFIAVVFGSIYTYVIYKIMNPILKYILLDVPYLIPLPVFMVLGICGQIGDLLESAMKRKFKVKDSGNTLGSHGGFCDRFDSMAFVFIVMYQYLKYIGVGNE